MNGYFVIFSHMLDRCTYSELIFLLLKFFKFACQNFIYCLYMNVSVI